MPLLIIIVVVVFFLELVLNGIELGFLMKLRFGFLGWDRDRGGLDEVAEKGRR